MTHVLWQNSWDTKEEGERGGSRDAGSPSLVLPVVTRSRMKRGQGFSLFNLGKVTESTGERSPTGGSGGGGITGSTIQRRINVHSCASSRIRAIKEEREGRASRQAPSRPPSWQRASRKRPGRSQDAPTESKSIRESVRLRPQQLRRFVRVPDNFRRRRYRRLPSGGTNYNAAGIDQRLKKTKTEREEQDFAFGALL